MTTGETIALTRWTSVGKVMFLLFNMLSRLVIAFLPRSKRLLISWLQSPSAVILEPPKIKSVTVSIVVCKSHLSAGPSQHLARILGAGTCSACLPWVSQKTRANRRLKGKQSKWGDHTHDELITVWLHFLEKEGNCAMCSETSTETGDYQKPWPCLESESVSCSVVSDSLWPHAL